MPAEPLTLASMGTFEVAPSAQAGHVLFRVATMRTKAKRVRRDVAPNAAGALAPMPVRRIDVRVCHVVRACPPRARKQLAGEAQKRRVARSRTGAVRGSPNGEVPRKCRTTSLEGSKLKVLHISLRGR